MWTPQMEKLGKMCFYPICLSDVIHDIIRNPLENSLSLKENRQRKQFRVETFTMRMTNLTQSARYDLLKVGQSGEN